MGKSILLFAATANQFCDLFFIMALSSACSLLTIRLYGIRNFIIFEEPSNRLACFNGEKTFCINNYKAIMTMLAVIIGISGIITAPTTANAETGKISAGTGFFYNYDGDLFTNRHVISGCQINSILVRTYDKNWHKARILAVDSRLDIAALSIDHEVPAFASFRLYSGTRSVTVPEETEDAFSAGFSSPEAHNFDLQYKWGQIQPWKDPNKFPYVNRMRMDAYPGASGSPVLDYAGLLIGIVFAGSVDSAPDYDNLRPVGYGDKWIFIYNNNALVSFANQHGLKYNAWEKWERKDPTFIWSHADRITTLILCKTLPSQ